MIHDKRPLLSGIITFVLLSLCLVFAVLAHNMGEIGGSGTLETTVMVPTSAQNPPESDKDRPPTTYPEYVESSVVADTTTEHSEDTTTETSEETTFEESFETTFRAENEEADPSVEKSVVVEDDRSTSSSSGGRRQIPFGIISLIFLVLALASLAVYLLKYRRQEQVFSIEIALSMFLLALAVFTYFTVTLVDGGGGWLFQGFRESLPGVKGSLSGIRGTGVGMPELIAGVLASAVFVITVRIVVGWLLKKADLSWSLLYRGIRNYRKEERKLYPLVLFPSIAIMVLLLLCGLAGFGILWFIGVGSGSIGSPARWRLWVTGLSFLLALLVMFMILTIRILIRNIGSADEIQQEIVSDAMTSERYRTDLVANVSHDLRTPLTSIIGYGELLEKESLSASGKEQLDKLNEKARYLREMVDELFELTKVSSGVTGIRKERIDLVKLLEQTLGIYCDELDAADLEIRRNYAAGTAPLDTDGTLLNQVFSNLFTNAVKYALPGTRVHVMLLDEDDAWHVKVINVSNYEMKFDEKEILERFTRADESRHTEGSGLGLAIARTYTEVLGGSFFVTIDGDQFTAHVVMKKPDE